jgi:indoleamine 2,3-dioxygenase
MECWDISNRGFLPYRNPVKSMRDTNENFWIELENLAQELPELVESRKWREESVARLRPLKEHIHLLHSKFLDVDVDECDKMMLERGMLLYSYFASAYVHQKHENVATHIPKEIAVPLVLLAGKVRRPPILTYASYCLTNWKNKFQVKEDGYVHNDPLVDDIELLQNFTAAYKKDEDWFILIHVDIEWQARHAVETIMNFEPIYKGDLKDQKEELIKDLCQVNGSLIKINQTMERMPENCRPDFYFNQVRPYIHGFDNVVYEDCFDNKPQSYRGETGAQSSIVPLVIAGLGIKHKDSTLTMHLDDMRNYMPANHRDAIARMEYFNYLGETKSSYADFAVNYRQAALEVSELKDIYNSCVEEVYKCRNTHLMYAKSYIEDKVVDPKGTGGTPYVPWLTQLRDESEKHYLK